MAVFGIAPMFHEDEDFHLYSRRLENFFIANHIEDGGQRRAIFLSVCGQKCYHLLHDLLFPQAPKETSYKNILATLEGILNLNSLPLWNVINSIVEVRKKEKV